MNLIASSLTDPRKFIEMPILLMEAIFTFTASIMEQSFQFAAQIARLMV